MTNIFEYLMTDERTLNEEVFDSFSNWMFEGDDETNELARSFLRWSVLFMITSSDGKLENSDFYKFFKGFESTDFDSFLNHLAKHAEIAVMIEQTLGIDQPSRYSDDNQSTYWYFFGKVMNHVENENLFPEQIENDIKTSVLTDEVNPDARDNKQVEGLSEEDMHNLSRIFSIVFVALVVAFIFFNFFL